MSFEDVARRMQQRHAEPLALGGDSEPPRSAPDADAFVRSIQRAERDARRRNDLVFGSLLLAAGLLITVVTFNSASQSGGTYIVAYGPIIVGVIKLARGLMM
jgi:hypothetical protein